jgi:hypothetical protein
VLLDDLPAHSGVRAIAAAVADGLGVPRLAGRAPQVLLPLTSRAASG